MLQEKTSTPSEAGPYDDYLNYGLNKGIEKIWVSGSCVGRDVWMGFALNGARIDIWRSAELRVGNLYKSCLSNNLIAFT